jgi:multiple sugar transport system permease protein
VRIITQELVAPDFRGELALGEVARSLAATVYYVIGTVPAAIVIAFLLAFFVFNAIRLRDLLRTVYFLPYVTSTVAAGLVFLWIFNPQVGVMNGLLGALGLPAQTWLEDPTPIGRKLLDAVGAGWGAGIPDFLLGPSVALSVIIVFSIWASLGFDVVIFLAGLTAIPSELEDAAAIDGAGTWDRIRYITLPLLSPTIFFLLVVSTIRAFQAFTPIFVLSGGGYRGQAGGPLGSTSVLTVEIFKQFYERPDSVGYAAAIALFLLACVLLLTWGQFRLVGRRAFYG